MNRLKLLCQAFNALDAMPEADPELRDGLKSMLMTAAKVAEERDAALTLLERVLADAFSDDIGEQLYEDIETLLGETKK